MANIATTDALSLTSQAEWTISSLAGWAPHMALPAEMTVDRLARDLADVERCCSGADRAQFGRAMAYLVAGGQRLAPQVPGLPDPVEIYYAELRQYPAAVLTRAVRQVVRSHVWDSPVKPAEIIQAAEADPEWARIRLGKARISAALWRARMDAKDEAEMQARKAARATDGPEKPQAIRMPDLSANRKTAWSTKYPTIDVGTFREAFGSERPLSPSEAAATARKNDGPEPA